MNVDESRILRNLPKIPVIKQANNEERITADDIFQKPCDYTDDDVNDLLGNDLDADIDFLLNM